MRVGGEKSRVGKLAEVAFALAFALFLAFALLAVAAGKVLSRLGSGSDEREDADKESQQSMASSQRHRAPHIAHLVNLPCRFPYRSIRLLGCVQFSGVSSGARPRRRMLWSPALLRVDGTEWPVVGNGGATSGDPPSPRAMPQAIAEARARRVRAAFPTLAMLFGASELEPETAAART